MFYMAVSHHDLLNVLLTIILLLLLLILLFYLSVMGDIKSTWPKRITPLQDPLQCHKCTVTM